MWRVILIRKTSDIISLCTFPFFQSSRLTSHSLSPVFTRLKFHGIGFERWLRNRQSKISVEKWKSLVIRRGWTGVSRNASPVTNIDTGGWKRQILDNVEGFLSEMIFLLKSISNGNWSWERRGPSWKSSSPQPTNQWSASLFISKSSYKWSCAVSGKSNYESALDIS